MNAAKTLLIAAALAAAVPARAALAPETRGELESAATHWRDFKIAGMRATEPVYEATGDLKGWRAFWDSAERAENKYAEKSLALKTEIMSERIHGEIDDAEAQRRAAVVDDAIRLAMVKLYALSIPDAMDGAPGVGDGGGRRLLPVWLRLNASEDDCNALITEKMRASGLPAYLFDVGR